MTAFSTVEKKSADGNEQPTLESRTHQGKKRTVLVAVVASLVTASVLAAVVISLFYGTRLCNANLSPKTEKFYIAVSDSPSTGRVTVNKEERVIITETRLPGGKTEDTITLQDFNRDLQAVKDLKRNECYVLSVMTSFDSALKCSQDNRTVVDPDTVPQVEKRMPQEPLPAQLLNNAVGGHIGEFCSGLPTFWLADPPTSGLVRKKRTHITIIVIGDTVIIIVSGAAEQVGPSEASPLQAEQVGPIEASPLQAEQAGAK